MGGLLIRWLGQASLHLRQIEQVIILAPHDVGKTDQVGENGTIAILPIQADHRLAQGKSESFHRLPQLSSVIAVPAPDTPENVPSH